MNDLIKISDKLSDLTGEGLEYLVKGNVVLAKFWNGNFQCAECGRNTDVTKDAS